MGFLNQDIFNLLFTKSRSPVDFIITFYHCVELQREKTIFLINYLY